MEKLYRGAFVAFRGNPFKMGSGEALLHESDGGLWIKDGRYQAVGPFEQVQNTARHLKAERLSGLLAPGFVDAHLHYPQMPIIGAFGLQLIDWLNKYTFPMELRFADPDFCRTVAQAFLQQALAHGITTAAVYSTVHAQSADIFFEESEKRKLRMITGKVLMDRNAPEGLMDSAQSGYDESKKLIDKWHGRSRLLYAITPRFAPTSTPEQLEAAGALFSEHTSEYGGVILQSHLSENKAEIAWVKKLYPNHRSYLSVYRHFGLLGPRAVYGHAIHLEDFEWEMAHETGTGFAHCPTSNLFIGSGLFELERATRGRFPVKTGLGCDIGGGTHLNPFMTMGEAYKIAQLRGYALTAVEAFWLHMAGAAELLRLENQVGNIAAGLEADFIQLDPEASELLKFRTAFCETIEELLFVLMTLGDDRVVKNTFIAGKAVRN